jgi:fluoride ion exporter CrcB/FEX
VLAGLLAADRITLTAPWREFVFVGLLGGFTTFSTFGLLDVRASRRSGFSTFGLETFVVARSSPLGALVNVAVHVIGGTVAVCLGYSLGVAGH